MKGTLERMGDTECVKKIGRKRSFVLLVVVVVVLMMMIFALFWRVWI